MTASLEIKGLSGLDAAIARAPATVYFWMRDAFGLATTRHRVEWLRSKSVDFGRGRQGIKVPRVNAAPEFPPDNVVAYHVRPKERRRKDAPLHELELDIGTTSTALAAHEHQITIRPRRGKLLAVPIAVPGGAGRGRKSPSAFRQKMRKSSELIALRQRSGKLILFERVRKRAAQRRRLERTKTGKVRARQPQVKVDRLIPRWVLIPEQKLRRRLGFYSTWDRLAGDRDRLFADRADRILRDMARGVRD